MLVTWQETTVGLTHAWLLIGLVLSWPNTIPAQMDTRSLLAWYQDLPYSKLVGFPCLGILLSIFDINIWWIYVQIFFQKTRILNLRYFFRCDRTSTIDNVCQSLTHSVSLYQYNTDYPYILHWHWHWHHEIQTSWHHDIMTSWHLIKLNLSFWHSNRIIEFYHIESYQIKS